MATKLEKLGMEWKRAIAKRDEWTQRAKDLEARYHEEENTVIHDMVHAANLTPEQLAQLIAQAAHGNVGSYPAGMVPAAADAETDHEDCEEEDHFNEN